MNCRSCGDPFKPWTCETCVLVPLVPGNDRCRECHDEVFHGKVGPAPGGALPRHEQHPVKWHEDEDMNRRSDP